MLIAKITFNLVSSYQSGFARMSTRKYGWYFLVFFFFLHLLNGIFIWNNYMDYGHFDSSTVVIYFDDIHLEHLILIL